MAIDMDLVFQKIGLTKTEARVYLSNLRLGTSKASEIAQKSGIKREASYYILKLLQEKGFISEVIKSGVKYYTTIDPKRLIGMIEEEKQRKSQAIKEILPELESLKKTTLTMPKIELYEGLEGLKTAASILVQKKNKEIYCYFPERPLHYVTYFHPQFRRKRREMNVRLKVIAEKTPFMLEDVKKKDKEELRETRFNEIVCGMDSAYYIMNDGVLILKANDKEAFGIYLKEESTAQMQRKIFEQIWKLSK
jgi:sugar-specific transcriptional regulator TrmB